MTFDQIIGPHPQASVPCGLHFSAEDVETAHKLPHRQLTESDLNGQALAEGSAEWIVKHHLSKDAIERDRRRREALKRQGFEDPTKRFPTNESTQKGNWAEILLAEYICSAGKVSLPVYRLRYNPNVDQSMKGDDVLAFDLDSDPVRILVGEAKFRGTPSKASVEDIISGLEKSHAGNIPASLQFVADRLFEAGKDELGNKVARCNELFVRDKLSLSYVGLLVSNTHAHRYVSTNGQSKLKRIALISLGCQVPEQLVDESFRYARGLIK